jgi:N-carbamoylputrescine amidase
VANNPIPRTLRVAAVQIESKHGLIEANHAHAVPFIEEAVAAGAELVVLPELFASGYIPNKSIWDFAEPRGGPTATWLGQTSKRLGVWLGAGLIETDGQDFFNVFVVCGPDGCIAGTARKDNAEAFCFKRGRGLHVIDTAISKIGVGICADNHFASLLARLQAEAVDLMLMPHAWPTPVRTTGLVSEQDIREQRAKPQQLAALYARCLGVPVVFLNGIGRMARLAGLLGRVMDPEVFRLEGRSRIIDSDGTLKVELGNEEGVMTADVTLDPARKRSLTPPSYRGWLHPGSAIARHVIIPLDIVFGVLSYTLDPLRRRRARNSQLLRQPTDPIPAGPPASRRTMGGRDP